MQVTRVHVVAVALCTVLVAEAGVRLAEPILPATHPWPARFVEPVAAIEDSAAGGGASVTIAEPHGVDRSQHVPGLELELLEAWAFDHVAPQLQPDLLVVGVLPVQLLFDPVRQHRRAEEVRASDGWRSVNGSVLDAWGATISGRSALVRNSESLRSPWRTLRRVQDPADVAFDRIGARGGWIAADDVDRPWSRRARDWWDVIDRGLVRDGPESAELDAAVDSVRRVIERATTSGTQVVLLLPPRHEPSLEEFALELGVRHADLLERLVRLAEETGVPLLDQGQLFRSTEHFADPVHVRSSGREIATDALAQELVRLGLVPGPG